MTARDIIEELIAKNVDGETMQYIVERVGMRSQMLRQLVLSAGPQELNRLIEEYRELYGKELEFIN